jgi:hypothetical protein
MAKPSVYGPVLCCSTRRCSVTVLPQGMNKCPRCGAWGREPGPSLEPMGIPRKYSARNKTSSR